MSSDCRSLVCTATVGGLVQRATGVDDAELLQMPRVRRIVEVQDWMQRLGKPFRPRWNTCFICLYMERRKGTRKHVVSVCTDQGRECHEVKECRFGGPVIHVVIELPAGGSLK